MRPFSSIWRYTIFPWIVSAIFTECHADVSGTQRAALHRCAEDLYFYIYISEVTGKEIIMIK